MFHFIHLTDKPAEAEQREGPGSTIAEVAPQAEENLSEHPVEGQTPALKLVEDVGAGTEKTVSQPDAVETPQGQEPPLKTDSASTPPKQSTDKEEEVAVHDSLEFQDDPADTDYAPSNYILFTLLFVFIMTPHFTVPI